MFSEPFLSWAFFVALLQVLIILGVTLRVILTRHPPGASLAWILITTVLPFVGFALYLVLGERPIGRFRAWRFRRWKKTQPRNVTARGEDPLLEHPLSERLRPLFRLASACGDEPVTGGNALLLLPSPQSSFEAIIEAIDAAHARIDLAFYIWAEGGETQKVADALHQARRRGVRIRLLVDDFASRAFLESETARAFREDGMSVSSAMPMTLLRIFGLQRADLRLHRKLIVIDERIAFTGSLNMIDPATYDAAKRVGDWVDAMVRIEGPAVKSLQHVFETDWWLQPDHESGDAINIEVTPLGLIKGSYPKGHGAVVAVPSGPNMPHDPNLHLLLETFNRANDTIVITTPYFVPNETLAHALLNALYRGVRVTIILPEKDDSLLVNFASRRYFDDLLSAGAEVLLYQKGLLHTKSVMVDEQFALFGTVNIDSRSLHLNYELMLLIADNTFLEDLKALLATYKMHCVRISLKTWRDRPLWRRLVEGLCFLMSPLL